MQQTRAYEASQRIHLYDGYQSAPIWQQPENTSTFYTYAIDQQCSVPIRDIEVLKKELEIE